MRLFKSVAAWSCVKGTLAGIGCALALTVGAGAAPQTPGPAPNSLEIYLGDPTDGYVDVTSYVQLEPDGSDWVVGYDNEPSFEIVIDAASGQVLDPFGNPIGKCVEE